MSLEHTPIPYTVRTSKRTRRMRLSVHHDGSVVLTAPAYINPSMIERFFLDKLGWITQKRTTFRKKNLRLLDAQPVSDYRKRKDEALRLVQKYVDAYSRNVGGSCKNIRIRNQKKRWGSCSKQGNITIHYRILDLSSELQTYIIVHELCHLKEFNHSKNFWACVESILPNYQLTRKELRRLVLPRR